MGFADWVKMVLQIDISLTFPTAGNTANNSLVFANSYEKFIIQIMFTRSYIDTAKLYAKCRQLKLLACPERTCYLGVINL